MGGGGCSTGQQHSDCFKAAANSWKDLSFEESRAWYGRADEEFDALVKEHKNNKARSPAVKA